MLAEFLRTWLDVVKHVDMLRLLVALIPDCSHVIEHMYELYAIFKSNLIRNDNTVDLKTLKRLIAQDKNPAGPHPFIYFYLESQFSLPGQWNHNPYINYYDHQYLPGDTSPVYVPSKLYDFSYIGERLVLDIRKQPNTIAPECSLFITEPDSTVTGDLLSVCHKISQYQEVTTVWMEGVCCDNLTAEQQPIISRNARSIYFIRCKFPLSFLKSILHQLSDSVTLQALGLSDLNLNALEEDFDRLLESLLTVNLKDRNKDDILPFPKVKDTAKEQQSLSQTFVQKW